MLRPVLDSVGEGFSGCSKTAGELTQNSFRNFRIKSEKGGKVPRLDDQAFGGLNGDNVSGSHLLVKK